MSSESCATVNAVRARGGKKIEDTYFLRMRCCRVFFSSPDNSLRGLRGCLRLVKSSVDPVTGNR